MGRSTLQNPGQVRSALPACFPWDRAAIHSQKNVDALHPQLYFVATGSGGRGWAIWSSTARQSGMHRVLPDGRCDIILQFRETPPLVSGIFAILTAPSATYLQYSGSAGHGPCRGEAATGLFPHWLCVPPGDVLGVALLPLRPVRHWRTCAATRQTPEFWLRGWRPSCVCSCAMERRCLPHKPGKSLARAACSGSCKRPSALPSGPYADQAHMSRAFRQSGGFSPMGMSNGTRAA